MPEEEEESRDDEDESHLRGQWFAPDMFMYGFMQGGRKMSTSASPSLMAAAHKAPGYKEGET